MTDKEKISQETIEDELQELRQAKITAALELATSQQNTMLKIAGLCEMLAELSDSINDEQNQHLIKINQYLLDWFEKERESDANRLYNFQIDTIPGLVRADIDGTKQ